MNKLFITLPALVLLTASCEQLRNLYKPSSDTKKIERVKVARVGNTYLYEDDIVGIVPVGSSSKDSSLIMKKFMEQWIKKQLTINRATQELEFDEANIERKVLDYRYALMVHEYEKYYVNQHLNKNISDEEITKYYNEKFENFVLRQNIVKCLFTVVPKEAPQIDNFRKLIKSYPNGELEEIQSYCYRFATKSSLESNLWIEFDEVINNTPITEIEDKVQYLKSNSYIETKDDENFYFIRLLDYKISNQISPLEYIRDDIESILINKKKVELRKQLEQDILASAKQNNDFEVFK
ncbi:peptidyl-prolyl cis-trans isomerase [Reichenbachiella versicolor]|uniref:peptidyl-prolyl cis-trans isomerase n=1 Tax=Reichenbachiella versicolor TaxID=1821036 RepID=UPI0013A56258|nr:peptidyl-prolyl cis-trans isomerase [Reichenbachiella versicolor]